MFGKTVTCFILLCVDKGWEMMMNNEKGRAVYGLLGVDCEWVVGMGGGE